MPNYFNKEIGEDLTIHFVSSLNDKKKDVVNVQHVFFPIKRSWFVG